MRINFDSIKPIYIQVAEAIEDDIVTGKLKEGEPVYSQLILSRELKINPATAAKGINQLVSKGVLEKQRGLSMTVKIGAADRLRHEQRDTGFRKIAESLVDTAIKTGITKETVITEISQLFESGAEKAEGGETYE
ncbi:MAG: GntR family transcriptional regulator [Oscillospiraceae bacterium]|nr:GntR family transcriptional regulator [Oscillospiraceae bacterium]